MRRAAARTSVQEAGVTRSLRWTLRTGNVCKGTVVLSRILVRWIPSRWDVFGTNLDVEILPLVTFAVTQREWDRCAP